MLSRFTLIQSLKMADLLIKKSILGLFQIAWLSLIILAGCSNPSPKNVSKVRQHNYIILLDLSDRIILNKDQTSRDEQLIKTIYKLFAKKVQSSLYIKSKDQIKILIAPQKATPIPVEDFENKFYINMSKIKAKDRRPKEEERQKFFFNSLDVLYDKAKFSNTPTDYKGADIWKYFNEDLERDLLKDSLSENFIFIFTDGYMFIEGKQEEYANEWKTVGKRFPNLKVMLLEATPHDIDGEWNRMQEVWAKWFQEMDIKDPILIKRGAINKIQDEIAAFLNTSQITNVRVDAIVENDSGLNKDALPTVSEIKQATQTVVDNKKVRDKTQKSQSPPPSITANSLEEYFEKIGDSKIPYSNKENLKNEIIAKYFADGDVLVIEKGANNTEVNRVAIRNYVEQLSQLHNKISVLDKKMDGNNKITTLYIKEL